MRIGTVFPQTEIGSDPAPIRQYAQTVEGLGYSHILAYDHVLGASTASRPDWSGPYTSETIFHEPFVLFGYLAALTQRVELVTGVLILPQRQTALVAKQAAEIDVLSGGRLRLGIGLGWNEVEYEALGESFATRGARIEEQIAVLRALWSGHAIAYSGRWHRIEDAGINPLPIRHTIPIWIGGSAESVLKRVARLADGWFPLMPPNEKAREMIERLHAYAREVGRDVRTIGIEARLDVSQTPEAEWASYADAWGQLGATHLGINTMEAGYTTLAQHLETLRRAKDILNVQAAA